MGEPITDQTDDVKKPSQRIIEELIRTGFKAGTKETTLMLSAIISLSKKEKLFDSIKDGDLDFVRGLLKQGVDPNATDMTGLSALHYAASCGQKEIAEVLVKAGARVDTKDKVGAMPIHYAAREGHLDIVKFFIEKGVDVNAATIHGLTAIHYSYIGNHPHVAEELIKAGAKADMPPNATPFLRAMLTKGYKDVLEALAKNSKTSEMVNENNLRPKSQ